MNSPTVLLFDIDGTLITTGGVGRLALERAVARAFGRPEERFDFPFGGMVDPVILSQGLTQLGLDASPAQVQAILGSYVGVLEELVGQADNYRALDGVVDVLDAVSGRDGVAVGLGTGNIEQGAKVKLARVALNHYFSFGGYGSDASERSDLLEVGAVRGARALGVARDACRVVVIGDTWRDVTAARAIGAECIAVSTGGSSWEELLETKPDLLVETLEDAQVTPYLLMGNGAR